MSNTEKQVLPGEPRGFEAKRDMKAGKNFVVTQSAGVKFEMETTYVQDEKEGWKVNTFQVVLRPGDEISVLSSDDKQFIEVQISSKDAVKNQRYRITKEVFAEVLEGTQIAILKKRAVEVAQEEVSESVKDILNKLPVGTVFKVKEKVAEDMIFGRHGIKKGSTLVIDSLGDGKVGIKVFASNIEVSKKGKLKTEYSDVTISVEDFERLLVETGAINFRKKADKILKDQK